MSQPADNPDRADSADLPDAGGHDLSCDTRTRPDLPAERDAAGALVALPEPASSEPQSTPSAPPIARVALANALWPLLPEQTQFLVLALATTVTVLFVRLFQLDQLQAEIYGDIAIVYEYLADIRAGNWPTYFSLSSGPLYHYLIMPIIALTGPSYYGMKLASAVVSLGILAATYALGRRLLGDHFALLAVFIAGVSSWLLIFSRLGNSQILVPLLSTCALWLAVRVAQDGRPADVVACAVVSTLGLYAYPQSFVLSPVIGLTLLCLRWTGLRVGWADLGRFALTTLVCALPFAWIVARDPVNFFSGYIGGKLAGNDHPVLTLAENIIRTLLALHVRGDSGFRSNPNDLPHLDVISGVLFLGGVIFWLLPERRRWSPALLVPLILLQVPSMLVLKEALDVPSASRTLGVAPIAYLLVASGVWWLAGLLRSPRRRWLRPAAVGALLAALLLLNVQRYFQTYIDGLPYQNTPMGRIITNYLDSLPPETQIYLVGCCWEYAMPEPLSIRYSMARPQQLHLVEQNELSCALLQYTPQPAVLVWSFHDDLPAPQLEACRAWLPAQMYGSVQGRPVFNAAPLRVGLALSAAPALDRAVADGQLELSSAQLDGQALAVLHSPLDIGSASNLFDGNPDTLIRGRDANPLVLDLSFAQPRVLAGLGLRLATMPHFQIKIGLTRPDGTSDSFAQDYRDLPSDPQVELALPGGSQQVSRLRIEIYDLQPSPGDEPHIHVREVQVR